MGGQRFEQLPDEILMETVRLYEECGTIRDTAAKYPHLNYGEIQRQMQQAARRGLISPPSRGRPCLPGFEVSRTSQSFDGDGNLKAEHIRQTPEPGPAFELPPGHVIKGVSSLVDESGRVKQSWLKTKLDEYAIDWTETFKEAFKDFKPAKAIAPPKKGYEDLVTVIPCNDWHINMLTWHREVGESWDLKIAERTIGTAIDEVIRRSPKAHLGIILGGGDLLHNDDNTNRTAKSHNVLDADGRHQKGIEVAQRLKVRTIDAALRHHEKVIVRILQGNHDEYSSVAIGHFLSAWYRNEPRVTVDLDASLFWWYRFGRVLLGATHGHTVRLSQMPSIMAHRRAEDWGLTKFRYVHGFHLHHKEKIATEGEGVICEIHQAPIPQDSWHFGSGYLSGRSVKTITYHKDFGEVSSAREAILDAAPK